MASDPRLTSDRSRVRRLAVATLVAVVGVLIGFAPPAPAHSAANTPASNYVSTITSVTPTPTSFSIRIIEAGSRLELRWRSGDEVTIPDYDGHPYLRIGPDGVHENQQSNAVYLNRSRLGSTTIPDGLDPEGPPEWKKIADEPVARWHDHRIHWMSESLPPQVVGRTGQRHLVMEIDVPIVQGTATFAAKGTVTWVPGPGPGLFIGAAVAAAIAIAAFALWARRTSSGIRSAVPVVVPALVVLVVADAIHLVGIAFGIQGSTGAGLGRLFSVGYVSIAAWVLAIVAIVLLIRRRDDALYLVTFAAGLMFVVGGLSDFSVLSRTSVPFAFSAELARWCIAATLGLGFGLAAAGVLLTRPTPGVAPRQPLDAAGSAESVPA